MVGCFTMHPGYPDLNGIYGYLRTDLHIKIAARGEFVVLIKAYYQLLYILLY